MRLRVSRSNLGVAVGAIGLYAAGGLVASFVGFLALPVFTRIFSPEEFGVIGLFTAAVSVLVSVISLGGYVYILYDRVEAHPAGVTSAVLLLAGLGAVVVLGGGLALALFTGLRLPLVALAVTTSWANVWIVVRLHTYQAANLPGRYFLLSAIPPVVAFIVTVGLAREMDGWWPRVVALGLTAAAGASWSAWSLRRSQLLNWRQALLRLSDVVHFGAPIVVHTASLWVVGFTDRYFVAAIQGIEAAGIYTVAYSVSLGVAAMHEGVSRYFVSRLPSWSETPEGRRAAVRFSRWYGVGAVVSAPVAVVAATVGLKVLVARDYSAATDLLLWLVPAQALAGVARIFNGYLYIDGRTRQRAAMSLAEAALNVALTWVLVVKLGTVGAAIGTTATYAFSAVGTYWLANSNSILKAGRSA